METKNRFSDIEKRQLAMFVMVAFGFTYLMGLPLSLAYRLGLDTYPFPNAQMFYPAAGVMLACLVTRRRPGMESPEESAAMPLGFFTFFVLLTALMAAGCWGMFIRPDMDWSTLQSYVIVAGSLLAWVFLLAAGKTRRAAYGLSWSGTGRSLLMLLLFVAIYLARSFFSVAISGQMAEYLPY